MRVVSAVRRLTLATCKTLEQKFRDVLVAPRWTFNPKIRTTKTRLFPGDLLFHFIFIRMYDPNLEGLKK